MGGPPLHPQGKHKKSIADHNKRRRKKKKNKKPNRKREDSAQVCGEDWKHNQVLSCPNSDSILKVLCNSTIKKRPKKRRKLGRDEDGFSSAGHSCKAPSQNPLVLDHSSEMEKQALREWVEMHSERACHGSSMLSNSQDLRHLASTRDQRLVIQPLSDSKPFGPASTSTENNGQAYLYTKFSAHKSSFIGHSCGKNGSCQQAVTVSNESADIVSNGIILGSGVSDGHGSRLHDMELTSSNGTKVSVMQDGLHVLPQSLNKKRKRCDDKVLQYVLKRRLVPFPISESRTTKTSVIAWGRTIPVTVTSEASTIQEWFSAQNGDLFGLDVEWRPNRAKDQKNKVALLQLCTDSECLIIQMLFLDRKPPVLCEVLSDPSKRLAGVGVLADIKRLLHDHGLLCQGGIELTTLAVERLKREELRHVGLKVLVQEILGFRMDKPKRVTLSNWAKVVLDPAQIDYACMDAWASFALSHKLLA